MPNRKIKHIVAKLVGASTEETLDVYDVDAIHTDKIYNALDQTAAGYVLDARQGKALIDSLNNHIIWINTPVITLDRALSAGQSGSGSYIVTIPSGYKATGICTVKKVHPGLGHAFYIIPAMSVGKTGTVTEYYTYGAIGNVAQSGADFNIVVECVKI